METFIDYLANGISSSTKIDFTNTQALLESTNEIPQNTLRNSFITELNQLKEELILVIDDFHLISQNSIIQLIDILVKHPIEKLHIYLVSRSEANHVTQQQLQRQTIQKINADNLSFSEAEMLEYAKLILGITLEDESLHSIVKRSEGWIMGLLQNLHLYNNDAGNKTEGDPSLNQFFLDEIILQQTEFNQHALVIGALFNRFSNALLHHILIECHEDFQVPFNITQHFVKDNLFLIALDTTKEWYRFHHHFQHTLINYGKLKFPKLINKYLKSGSQYLAAHGFYEEALAKAVETGDAQHTIQLLEAFKYGLLNIDHYVRFKHLLDLLPNTWLEEYPELKMNRLIVLQYEGKINAIDQSLKQCSYFESNKNIPRQTLAEYYIYKGMLCTYKGDNKAAIHWLDKGIDLTQPHADSLRTYATFFKSHAISSCFTLEEALSYITASIDSLPSQYHHSRARVLIARIMLHKNRNDFSEMERLLPDLINTCEQYDCYEVLGLAYNYQAEILYRQNRFDELGTCFEKVYCLRHQVRASWFICTWYFKALYHLKCNKLVQVQQTINELETYTNELESEELKLLLKYIRLDITLQKGAADELEMLLSRQSFCEIPPLRTGRYYYPRISYLKLLLHQNTKESIKAYKHTYNELHTYANNTRNQDLIVQLSLLNCLALYKFGQQEEASSRLLEVIQHQVSKQDLMVFTEYGKDMQELIRSLSQQQANNRVQLILNLIQDINQVTPPGPTRVTRKKLKARDIKILNLVSDGLKNDEIAETMCLSPDSIKKYLYNVYQELEVNNRIKAARKAKELGLLKEND
ncbi:MAG: LuxR C-terminal-related transcriptional regulator [Carboxylicivirga sp.]|nr:LuxR C-terminal-related transcriptional regulator [Carboxylicivirga sp.]